MELSILYDNDALKGYRRGWGFSCLAQYKDMKIMFDTGWDVNILDHNLKKTCISKEDIDMLFLSHDHWDHTGGISMMLHPELEVYVPGSFSRRLMGEISKRAVLHMTDGPKRIKDGVYTTGLLGGSTREQAMALELSKGLLVITGCAHPGLGTIIGSARQFGDVMGVVGGFHDLSELEQLSDLEIIIPCHCTERKREILERYPENARPCGAGERMIIE